MNDSPGIIASLRGFGATAVALFRTRLELLQVEAREEVGRISGLLVWGIATVLLGIVGAVFFAVFLTVLFWDSNRLLVLGIASALFLVAAFVAGVMALKLNRQGSQLFAASLAELRRDTEALGKQKQP